MRMSWVRLCLGSNVTEIWVRPCQDRVTCCVMFESAVILLSISSCVCMTWPDIGHLNLETVQIRSLGLLDCFAPTTTVKTPDHQRPSYSLQNVLVYAYDAKSFSHCFIIAVSLFLIVMQLSFLSAELWSVDVTALPVPRVANFPRQKFPPHAVLVTD